VALFRKESSEPKGQARPGARPLIAQNAHCRVCGQDRSFSAVWMRVDPVRQCPCCGLAFENPAALYEKFQPACPRCEEFLEQPGFIYGFCDGCGSKFELMPNSKPSLIPNRTQRAEMNKHGKAHFAQ